MKASEFKKLLKNEFSPALRNLGFKGSGFNYRKITNEHYIYTATVQSCTWGEGCWIELGVTTDFLPDTLGKEIDVKKVTPYKCEFRKRLKSPTSTINDSMWPYGNTEDEANLSIEEMIQVFETEGIAYFDKFKNFPEPLSSITVEDIVTDIPRKNGLREYSMTEVRLALTLARVHTFLGNKNEAIELCNWGLENIGRGIGLIEVFEDIKRKNMN
ncbi:DUF4304 domain-containing protein [Methanolobus zinderi]|uniref:DUF4304 domain-containing protein n=1 Tax=Methanolobus zinderi TaxID=536044 RepID=A0A7D5EG27_9EURY|nr:DUF4304 domain-containing protein [Methanolobus zinderi]KXS40112.1 MAG: hypothetical protein AWU59_2664 [Methanolobus sp. T82-4]QLC49580.1 DUF4304 domain-containing protein [Methanolobus zinderi]